ncbi:uncharacterized protein LOC131940338 [Physella acuta]|uniref:uncharacterized protein LOC131940338 n=1 Tax=Physella acuta TaxID=109671 RepID=UPI0027DCCBAF|nr:uncharacterized protein LOC131940338 [Physella acuta]XP_059154960.1 uncharacterized protein LOC131940338 [Physella acuta]
MADRNQTRNTNQDNFYAFDPRGRGTGARPPIVPSIRPHSPPREPGRFESSFSPSQALTRDSGYNTDVSPATTVSPATHIPVRQHFTFDELPRSHCEGDEHLPTLSAFNAPRSPLAHVLDSPARDRRGFRRSTPPLRVSPEIFRTSASPASSLGRGALPSPRPVSEASDVNTPLFDFDSEEEEDNRDKNETIGTLMPPPACRAINRLEHSRSLVHYQGGEEDVDEKNSLSCSRYLEHWVQTSNMSVSRYGGLSARRRRHASEHIPQAAALHEPGEFHAYRSQSFSDSLTSGEQSRSCQISRDSSLSQGFQPGCRDTFMSRSSSYDSENVFTFDPDDIDDYQRTESSTVTERRSAAVNIVHQRPPQSPASRYEKPPQSPASRYEKPPQSPASRQCRRRSFMASSHVRMSNGTLLPWAGTILGVSVSTQTPHMASLFIEEIVGTPLPLPLPYEAIGTAAATLRRRSSESGVHLGLHSSSAPLPDIIPTMGRDRSHSVPDFHALQRAERTAEAGRQVGRELRRMSDEFNFSFVAFRRLSPVNEELFDGHPSSYPSARGQSGVIRRLQWLWREATGRRVSLPRSGSSVDLSDQQAGPAEGASSQGPTAH